MPTFTSRLKDVIVIMAAGLVWALPRPAGGLEEIGLEELLNRVNLAREAPGDSITNYVCQSTFIMLEPQKDGTAKTVLIEDKTVYFRPPDQKREIFRSATKEGEVLSSEQLAEYQKKADEEARQHDQDEDPSDKDSSEKNKGTFSFSAASPWSPEERDRYTFQLLPPDTVRGMPAYVVKVTPREKSEDLVDGIAWFHEDLFRVIKLEFQPAKNPRFVKKAHVIMDFDEVATGHWLPVEMRMDVSGGFLFIKKSFQMHQTWRDYQVNVDLPDSLFLPSMNF
jgi:hypothetical protein